MGTLAKICREVPLRRVVESLGSTFGLGVVSASGYQFLNTRTCARLMGGHRAMSVPLTTQWGGFCAAYLGLSIAIENALVHYRIKEDPTEIAKISTMASLAILNSRWSLRTSACLALVGSCMIGASIMLNKLKEKEEEELLLNQTKILEPPIH